MPYIDATARTRIANDPRPGNLGELDYLLTSIVVMYMRDHHITRFDQLAGVVGVLDLVKDETKRRVVHPYEDGKRALNGDVYE